MITDEDLVHITLFDDYISHIDHKFQRKKDSWNNFIDHCKMKGVETAKKLNVDAPKIRKQIE